LTTYCSRFALRGFAVFILFFLFVAFAWVFLNKKLEIFVLKNIHLDIYAIIVGRATERKQEVENCWASALT
jgi:hypothetical protein